MFALGRRERRAQGRACERWRSGGAVRSSVHAGVARCVAWDGVSGVDGMRSYFN